jgi:hypothetical protein
MDGTAIFWTAITGLVGTVAGIFGKTFMDWVKEKNVTTKSHNDQAFILYNDLIMKLEAKIEKLELRILELEKNHFDCQKENLILQGKMARLEDNLIKK